MNSDGATLDLCFVTLTTVEKSRTYVFPDNQRVTFHNVNRVSARPGRSHRLETSDGKKYIIKDGWLAIEIDTPKWSF